jgi:hypothetical protein
MMTEAEIDAVIEQDMVVLRETARVIAKHRGLATYNSYALYLHRTGGVVTRSIFAAAAAGMEKPGFLDRPAEEQKRISDAMFESCR